MKFLGQNLASALWVRGILALIFGIIAVVMPGTTAAAFALLWGIYALVDGVAFLGMAFAPQPVGARIWNIVLGLLGIVAGLIAILNPADAAGILAWVLGIWLIAHGITEIVGAFTLSSNGRWWIVLAGVLWIIAGVIFMANPFATAVALALWISALAIAWGIFCIVAGIFIRRDTRTLDEALHG